MHRCFTNCRLHHLRVVSTYLLHFLFHIYLFYRYQGYYSPFYNDSHRTFRASTRAFVETHVKPFVDQWVEEGEYPKSLHKLAHDEGISTVIYRAAQDYYTPEDGPSPSTYDAFDELILWDELYVCSAELHLRVCLPRLHSLSS